MERRRATTWGIAPFDDAERTHRQNHQHFSCGGESRCAAPARLPSAPLLPPSLPSEEASSPPRGPPLRFVGCCSCAAADTASPEGEAPSGEGPPPPPPLATIAAGGGGGGAPSPGGVALAHNTTTPASSRSVGPPPSRRRGGCGQQRARRSCCCLAVATPLLAASCRPCCCCGGGGGCCCSRGFVADVGGVAAPDADVWVLPDV